MLDKFEFLFSNKLEAPKEDLKEELKEKIKCKCNRNTFTGIVSQRRSFSGCSNFQPFYHIAAMNNWKEVVKEQKNICDKLNLKPICGVLGSNKDVEWLKSIGLNIQYHSKNIHEYEIPTLKILYDWSKQNQDGRVLYFHTKGVSAPEIIGKKYWRWIMNEQILMNYKDNLKRLDIADILGISWMDGHFAHFAGNFWMARCDWINILQDPIDYQKINGPTIANNPWKRMSAELWLGSKPYHIADSLCGSNLCMYCEDLDLYDKYRNI